MGNEQHVGAHSLVPELTSLPAGAPSETRDEKNAIDFPGAPAPTLVAETDTDNTTRFYNLHRSSAPPLTPDIAAKITRRNFWFLLAQTWWISFLIHLDEGTLGQASTMGIFDDVDMTKKQYNDLFVVYYVGYLVALWPGAWVAQRVGHKYFITGSLFLWSLLIGLHPAVKTGKQLMALRFILGLTQSQIIPSTTVLHQSFFPPRKSPWVQLLWWAAGSFASVLLTMVSYRLILNQESGILVGGLASWKWLNIICAILTFAVFVPLFLFLPNSPVDAKWLGIEEKVHTIEMMRNSQSGIANSAFKWDQVKECFTDLKSWLFIFHMFFNELPNNTGAQLPLIVVGFGFTPAESALLNIVKPIWGSVLVCITALVLNTTDLGTGYVCAMSYIPCVIGGIIELSAPWSNKVALVLGTQISSFKPSYLLGLTWAGTTTTGYTKKLTLMSTCVISASVANMISPEFWQEKYQPRYTLPWAFMTTIWVICPTMCLIIRYYLSKENKRRDMIMPAVTDESSEKEFVATFGSEQELVQISATGLEFLKETLPLSDGPQLTLLVRTTSKLPQDLISQYASKVTIVEGGLSDDMKLDEAMKGVTTVVSFLGAYMSFTYLVTRAKPTPIADSFSLIKGVMKKHGVKRLLALSTPSHAVPGEQYNWTQWFTTQIFPPYIVPQGDAEMTAIGKMCADDDFDYTIFRVPHLTNGAADLKVYAGFYGPEFKGTQQLSRASLARWTYQEILNKQWIRQQPALGNF